MTDQPRRTPTSPATRSLTAADTPRRTVGIYMVGILPGNLERSLGFYRGLGVELTQDGSRLHFASRQHEAVVFFVNGTGALVPPQDAPRVVLEFRLPDADLVDRVYAEALLAGGQPYRSPELAPFGDYVGLVLDPDGNLVALSAPGRTTRPAETEPPG